MNAAGVRYGDIRPSRQWLAMAHPRPYHVTPLDISIPMLASAVSQNSWHGVGSYSKHYVISIHEISLWTRLPDVISHMGAAALIRNIKYAYYAQWYFRIFPIKKCSRWTLSSSGLFINAAGVRYGDIRPSHQLWSMAHLRPYHVAPSDISTPMLASIISQNSWNGAGSYSEGYAISIDGISPCPRLPDVISHMGAAALIYSIEYANYAQWYLAIFQCRNVVDKLYFPLCCVSKPLECDMVK
jgi:hypothetical protein